MSTESWIPEGIQLDKPSAARMYDYLLGGYHNFEIDRLAAERAREIFPEVGLTAQTNRAFLRRVVNFLVQEGIDQFLDVGSGIPTVGNVHKVAQRANPAARVVYVDIDPIAVTHSLALLEDNPYATAIQADARQPELILEHPKVEGLIDFSRPAAVLFLTLLHFIPDNQQAYQVVYKFRDALAPGSYIAVSHGTYENAPPEMIEKIEQLGAGTTTPHKNRSRAEIEPFFHSLELVEPGLVLLPLWRPEGQDDLFLGQPERSLLYGGIGRKP